MILRSSCLLTSRNCCGLLIRKGCPATYQGSYIQRAVVIYELLTNFLSDGKSLSTILNEDEVSFQLGRVLVI